MFKTLVLVGIGGALGSVLRYLTTLIVAKYFSTIFPLATFIINILGCLLIGILMGWLEKNQLTDASIKWLLVTGFCGSYTTFSAFGYENITLLQNGNSALAFLYIISSVVIGLIAVWLGLTLVK